MKRITNINTQSNTTDIAILIARLAVAALMLNHGLPKMQALFSGDPIQFPPIMGMSSGLSLTLAVFAEVFCSILVGIGFLTRISVIPSAITMLVAISTVHAADPFAKKELAVVYLVIYVILFFAGSGKYSADYLWQRKDFKPVYAA